jgi:hypothetical protein
MDEWERRLAEQKAGGRRVLSEGYMGLARDVAGAASLIGRGLFEMGARLVVPTRGMPKGNKKKKKD